MKRHARPMADHRRAQGIRYRAAVIRDAVIFLAIAAALLAVATYSGPPPY
jgi:hypothetical protein